MVMILGCGALSATFDFLVQNEHGILVFGLSSSLLAAARTRRLEEGHIDQHAHRLASSRSVGRFNCVIYALVVGHRVSRQPILSLFEDGGPRDCSGNPAGKAGEERIATRAQEHGMKLSVSELAGLGRERMLRHAPEAALHAVQMRPRSARRCQSGRLRFETKAQLEKLNDD